MSVCCDSLAGVSVLGQPGWCQCVGTASLVSVFCDRFASVSVLWQPGWCQCVVKAWLVSVCCDSLASVSVLWQPGWCQCVVTAWLVSVCCDSPSQSRKGLIPILVLRFRGVSMSRKTEMKMVFSHKLSDVWDTAWHRTYFISVSLRVGWIVEPSRATV